MFAYRLLNIKNMQFLKVVNSNGVMVLVQIANITAIWEKGESTIISMLDPRTSITIDVPIWKIEKAIFYASEGAIIEIE